MRLPSFLKKTVIYASLFCLSFTQIFVFPLPVYAADLEQVDVVEADNETDTLYDLVVLVVDKELRGISAETELQDQYELREDGIEERVSRYADDLIENNDLTDVKIIFFDKEVDTVATLSEALENLYISGDGGHHNQLRGVVLVGDVPLPVVDKSGNKFISMFPYTDFVDKAYIYNSETDSFERNENVGFPKPEAWHGVIKAKNINDLAEFFDKNHLYYTGEPMFAKFDRKLFFGDLLHEEEQMHPDVYKRYVKYLEASEDLIYLRYNKFWAQELSGGLVDELPIDFSNEAPADNDLKPSDGDFLEALQNSDSMAGLPDIYTKSVVDQTFLPYYKVLNRYISSLNDWADYTGRYKVKDVDSVPGLISMKDDYTRYYLKSVNDALEKKINELVEKIEQPLPLLDATVLSGSFGKNGDDFTVLVTDTPPEDAIGQNDGFGNQQEVQPEQIPITSHVLRFNYLNEVDDNFYINGINVNDLEESPSNPEVLKSAKICAPYLGSTESQYFNEELQFNPKAVDGGQYSILTRSLRSDDFSTALQQVTAGVNTRIVSPEELSELTNQVYGGTIIPGGPTATGAVVEKNPDYGVPAFIDNTVGGGNDFTGPFEDMLKEGDVITAVNGHNLGFAYTFDQAIEESYNEVVRFMNAIKDEEVNTLGDFKFNVASLDGTIVPDPQNPLVPLPDPLEIWDDPAEMIASPKLRNIRVKNVMGVINVEYYSGGEKKSENLTFSVKVHEDTDDVKQTSAQSPSSTPDIKFKIFPKNIDFPNGWGDSQGALFTLYENDMLGYGGEAYDASAGCNANSTSRNSDRCLGKIATMPVLDPAGSLAPVKMTVPGRNDPVLQFPVNVKKDNAYVNSGREEDWENAVDSYAFPAGDGPNGNQYYGFEDIDDVYLNSCFGVGLPSYQTAFGDSNPYELLLSIAPGNPVGTPDLDRDWYGQLLKSFAKYASSNLADETDYVHGGGPRDSSDFSPKAEIWLNLDELDASDILINTVGQNVSLKNFSDHFGLFDGVDNNGDGIADYRWSDENGDGVAETKLYDYEEANPLYGLPSWNLPEIARKFLSHESNYVLPFGTNSFKQKIIDENWGTTFDSDLILKVRPHQYAATNGNKISSVVLHNEPTGYTISEQIKSQSSFSLPIDDPRYVAFQTQSPTLPVYPAPEPIGDVDVEAITAGLDLEDYYTPGQTAKVDYINLFDENIRGIGDLGNAITSKARELARLPGAQMLIDPNAEPNSYSYEEIEREITNRYLAPVVTNILDDPISGFNLRRANTVKLTDALDWLNMNIDEKHQYVLEYYLNGDREHNAYVNDASLMPAPFGSRTANGYEASYLVLDGQEDYFEMNFNKDLPEEDDGRFDPLNQDIGAGAAAPIEGADVEAEEDEDWEFVWLDQFLEELMLFVDGFTSVPNFTQACGFNPNFDLQNNDLALTRIDRFQLDVDRYVASIKAADEVTVTGTAYDVNGNVIVTNSELINLSMGEGQNAFRLTSSNSKQLENGQVQFKLSPTENVGNQSIKLESSEGAASNTVQISSTNKEIKIFSDEDSIVADGEGVMEFEVQVWGDDGRIESDVGHQLEFSLDNELASIVGDTVVSTENGVAFVKIKTGTKTGFVKLRAEVISEGIYPYGEKEVELEAGDPVAIGVESNTFLLVANNQSKAHLTLSLYDQFGNLANNDFSQIGVFNNIVAEVDPSVDTSSAIIGSQINTVEGVAELDVIARDQPGLANLIFILMDRELEDRFLEVGDNWEDIDFVNEIGASISIDVVDKVDLSVKVVDRNFQAVDKIVANKSDIAGIGVEMLYQGRVVESYNGPIGFEVLTTNLGNFKKQPVNKMSNGVVAATDVLFKSSSLTGEVEISIDVPGFATTSAKLKTITGEATKIELVSSEDVVSSNPEEDVFLQARLLDNFGNLVTGNNGTRVEFSATGATDELVNFDPASALSLEGVSSTQLVSTGKSGTVNLVAGAEGLEPGHLSLDIKKFVRGVDVDQFSPRSLYISLLGGNFGNELIRENLAQKLLFSGQSQAVSAVTAASNGSKKLISVDAYGVIDLVSNQVEATVVPASANLDYHKIILSDRIAQDELATLLLKPKELTLSLLEDDQELKDINNEGVFVKIINPAANLKAQLRDAELYIEEGSERHLRIDNLGRIFVNNDNFAVRLADENDGLGLRDFAFIVTYKSQPYAVVSIKQKLEQNVRKMNFGSSRNNLFPGFAVQLASNSKKYALEDSFSRNSSTNPMGLYLVDTESPLASEQKPGFAQTSLENADNNFGLGFEGENKHMLLFSAGNSVGESHMPYASEVGIIYGDPMIRLEVEEDLISGNSGYSRDLGRSIYTGQDQIKEMIQFDMNGDARDDLLLVYEDGIVRLLENTISNRNFVDKGVIMNIFGEVLSMSKIDINNDSFDDLIVGTKDSCNEEEECVGLYINNGGGFDRQTLDLALDGKKIYEMKSADLNLDGCDDLVTSNSSGEISVYHNKIKDGECSGLETEAAQDWNFGFEIDQNNNQKNNLFIYYPGMDLVENKVLQFSLQGPTPAPGDALAAQAIAAQAAFENNSEISESEIPELTFTRDFDFAHLPSDSIFGPTSSKIAIDVNGGSAGVGDQINYVISLRNTSGSNINNLILSDTTALSMSLLPDSLACLDAGCNDEFKWQETGMSMRSHVIQGISVPAGGVRTIKYSMIVDQMPKVKFDIGNNFTDYQDEANNNDPRLDIMVRPEVNPEGVISYLYSAGIDNKGRVRHLKYNAVPAIGNDGPEIPIPGVLLNPGNITDDPDSVSTDIKNILGGYGDEQSHDSDYNGCSDIWGGAFEKYENAADAVADGMENALSLLRCSGGGCSPIPYNYATLVPDGATPGIALVAFGTPTLPPVLPFYPSTATSAARIYISPTLSGGLGTAVCVGPGTGHASPCYAFAVPGGLPGASGVCDQVIGAVGDAIAYAKDAVVDSGIGKVVMISDGSNAPDIEGGEFETNFGAANDPISAAVKGNVKIPGFPSVITNWLDKQVDEIYNKLLDFPKFYLILPDVGPFLKNNVSAASEVSFQSFNDFATTLSSIPLIQIEGKEIVVRIPAVSKNEIEKYKEQWKKWKKDMQKQLDDRLAVWKCDENEAKKNICDKITVDMNDLINGVSDLLDLLDQIAALPRKILNYRQLEAKYATQIICYLDAVMSFTGGYISKQQKIVESWLKAVEDAIKTFKKWQALLDLVVDYQTACDQCKNDRFSKLNLLLQIFVAIPEPPIIAIPKWPDLVVDLSQIKTGVKIVWPDVTFRPEAIKLPNLPNITLPEFLPEVSIKIPGFDVPDLPTFVLPDLPDLPPLPLPQLPDIPRPPKIPDVPNVVVEIVAKLKPIFRILCLLKNGLVPVPESALETEIETLTQPSVQAVLPLIAQLGTQWPAIQYDYVKEIRVTAKLRFDVETEFIYNKANEGFKIWNEKVKNMVKNINKFTEFPYGEILSNLIQKAIDEQFEKALENGGGSLDLPLGIDVEVQGPSALVLPEISPEDIAADYPEVMQFKNAMEDVNDILSNYIATLDQQDYPETYNLFGTQTLLDSDDPILNRSLNDVQFSIAHEDLPDSPAIKQLAAVRNSLIDYTQGIYDSNDLLENIDSLDDFGSILAQNDQDLPLLATTSYPTSGPDTVEFSFLGDAIEEKLTEAAYGVNGRTLLAADVKIDQRDLAQNQNNSRPQPVGFYVVGNNGLNENVLNYTSELKKKTHIIFSDFDADGDDDIIYSMGGDVYLKENREIVDDLPNGRKIENRTEIKNYLSAGGVAVQGLSSPYLSSGTADLSWLSAGDNTYGYEIVLKHSIYTSDRDRSIQRYLALANPIDSEESKILLEKMNPPQEFILELSNKDKPQVTLDLENGNYYAYVYALTADGERSMTSAHALLAPQSCADTEAPFPAISSSVFDVAIYEELKIDASRSFDAGGEIVEAYLESKPYAAADGMVFTTVAPKINRDRAQDELIFTVGPFVNEGDIGQREFVLHLIDKNRNSSKQSIKVNIFAPDITLDPSFARTQIAVGKVLPNIANIPFKLIRDRYIYRIVEGKIKLVPRSEIVRTGKTDVNGAYQFNDFDDEDMILVENSAGEIIAEIDSETGNIGKLADGYQVVVTPAQVPGSPTRVDIIGPGGVVMGSVVVVGDPNSDVIIHKEFEINGENYKDLNGVHANDLKENDQYELISLLANDPSNPGAVLLVNRDTEKTLAMIDPAGNIIVLDEGVTLAKKENIHKDDPLMIVISVENVAVVEVYIGPDSNKLSVVGSKELPYRSPRTPSAGALYSTSNYTQGAYADIINSLDLEEGRIFDSADLVTRAEFVRVLLNMLCIIPREPAAYQPYASGEGYDDIIFDGENLDNDYPYIKEATLLNLIEGYKGDREDDSGLLPFRPGNTITRAEAVKVILRALEMKGVVDLTNVEEGDPWYGEIFDVAQDLGPYMTADVLLANNYIITEQEAAEPNEEMTFDELLIMVRRVLDIYSCQDSDLDQDGVSDFCEEKYKIDDPTADPDGDGILNAQECLYGLNPRDADTEDDDHDGLSTKAEIFIYKTDPYNPDTDSGGVIDGDEVANFTDPLFAADDNSDDGDNQSGGVLKDGEPGIYLQPAECNTCPCVSTFIDNADIMPGDVFYPVISIDYADPAKRTHIFSKGNEVLIEN